MLIQQTVYLNTEEILIEQRQHFSQRNLSWKKLVQIFVLLFLHYHTQTRILNCVLFFYVFNFPVYWIFWSPLLFLSIFYFFLKDVALVDYYLDKDTILEDLDC